jgi:hypothetical protein
MFNTTTEVQSGLALSRVKAGCLVGLIFLLVAGLVSLQRMTNPAFGAEGDLPFHYYFTRAFNQSLSEGDWLPRWAGLLEGGRGDALFTFYPPLCFLLSAGLARLFKTDLVTGLKLTTFLCLLLAQLNAYLFARAFFTRKQSLLAAAVFVLLPAYPLITLNRALLPNGLALSFVPLVLLATHRLLLRKGARSAAALFAFSLSIIICTHVITIYLCALAVAVMTLCYLPVAKWAGLRNLILAGLLALALTAFFLLPLGLEINWVNAKMHTEQQDYRSYFLFAPPRSASAYHQAWAALNQAASCITLLQTALALLLGCVLWRKAQSPAQRLLLRFSLALTSFGLLISLPLSRPLWEWLPGLAYLQFPWRLQPLVALSCGLLLACLWFSAQQFEKRRPLVSVVTLLLLANAFFTYATTRLAKTGLSHAQVLQLLEASDLAPTTTEELRERQTKGDLSYMPLLANQVQLRPRGADMLLYPTAHSYGSLSFISGRGQILAQRLTNQQREFRLQTAEPVRVRLNTYAYPHWVARLDGQELPIETEPGSGLMLLALPTGEHTLTFAYEVRQPLSVWARRVSALSWLLFAAWVLWLAVRERVGR